MEEAGLNMNQPYYFLPAFEYYNSQISNWTKQLGVTLVNYSPGSTSNADYTTPDMKSYRSSNQIYDNIIKYEANHTLNGFMLLTHIGTDNQRTDKFYNKLDQLIVTLQQKGYNFVPINILLNKK